MMLLGFLIGMRHALDADHVLAIASITSLHTNQRGYLKLGLVWGIGHTVTLVIVGIAVLIFQLSLPESLAPLFEALVGLMLVVMGGDVLRKIVNHKWHIHWHQHADKPKHLHFHSHQYSDLHQHVHPRSSIKSLLVGMLHGLAGSSALILLTLQTMTSPWLGIIYILIFGFGSILGMGLLSWVIAIPLNPKKTRLLYKRELLPLMIGSLTLTLGGYLFITKMNEYLTL